MGIIFSAQTTRKIYIASQNCFQTPIKHPSKTVDSSQDTLFATICTEASSNSNIKSLITKICEEKIKENPIKAGAYLNLLLCELSESSSYDTSPRTVAINAKKIINKHPEKTFPIKKSHQCWV